MKRDRDSDLELDNDFGELLKRVARTPSAPAHAVPSPRLAPGTAVGSYRVDAFLADGGMGAVYRAIDETSQRPVALKRLRALEARAEDVERFRREAEALSTVRHPNVVEVYEIGAYDGGPYVAMELLSGQTVRDRLAGGALPWREAVNVTLAVLAGLSATHAAGIVHRDVKPENVFLTDDGGVKLLDFGLAKSFGNTAASQRKLTAENVSVGTPHYMAPEQVFGRPVDSRTDLFALGAVTYEMIAGRRAFDGKSPLDVLAAVERGVPAPLVDVAPGTPLGLDAWLARCLARRPNERFDSAEAAARALDDACD